MAESVLIVGLGNPGQEYVGTRHNVGFDVIDRLSSEWKIDLNKSSYESLWGKGRWEGKDVILQKPQTFMNLSGRSVSPLMSFFKLMPGRLLVVHDDLDLTMGRVKPGYDSRAAGHRGIASIIELLGTQGFHRLKLGIGRPTEKGSVSDFVLSRFEKSEKESLEMMLAQAVSEAQGWLQKNK